MERLKNLREEQKLSQAKLGKEIGVDNRTISQYENGLREPDYQTLKKLCDFFNVTAGYLLGFED